jgi:flagellar motility protein MotE (MotC chaperone)
VLALLLVLPMLGVAPRYGNGMSQLKGLVNKVRPGTFPDLEAQQEQQPSSTLPQPERQEALTDTERQILLSLMERKRQLDERDVLLNQREEQLRALRDNIQRQVAELKQLQEQIEASMDAKRAQDAENLNKVVNLFNGMDPKVSAIKLQTLDTRTAAQILLAMNQRKASQLLEAMDPQQAKRITEEIVSKGPATQ